MSHSAVPSSPLAVRAETVRKIAIFRALFLGDLLCAVPALRALRRRYPHAEITLIGLSWAADFVRRVPYVDRFVAFPGYEGVREVPYNARQTRAFLAEAHATGYDLALQMHGTGEVSNGFVAALGARVSLGYRAAADDRLAFSLLYEARQHEILRWLRLVEVLGAPTDDLRTEFPVTKAEERQAIELLAAPSLYGSRSGQVIGLHAGAKDPARRWSPERFAAVADALVERFGARIVLTGSAGERNITAAVQGAMRHPVRDLAGLTDLGTFAALIGHLDLLITNDTGASHLAAAANTPSVVLFGPSRPEEWAPLDRERHHVIDALALDGHHADPSTALQYLPVAPVLDASVAALEHRESRAENQEPSSASREPKVWQHRRKIRELKDQGQDESRADLQSLMRGS
ncbi:MAG TPA: glycosyltransferase family 9 protein [Herpetosiphonaceae bacterium]